MIAQASEKRDMSDPCITSDRRAISRPLSGTLQHAILVLFAIISWGLYGCDKAEDMPAVPEKPEEIFDYGDSKFPIIYAGESIALFQKVQIITYFQPLFGKERSRVNPVQPRKEDNKIIFDTPGEYYLMVNDAFPLKVIVLDPEEKISEGVLRIFDFSVANLLACNANDIDWNNNSWALLSGWFQSLEAKGLLCGPTAELFRRMVYDRFRLPSRWVTFPGTYRGRGKQIGRNIHNVVEVYLPEQERFVMFDINNALVVRWKSAMDIAKIIHAETDSTALMNSFTWQALIDRAKWSKSGLDVYRGHVQGKRPKSADFSKSEPNTSLDEWISDDPLEIYWPALARVYYGGVAYFGGNGYGTEFLKTYTFGSLHDDKELELAAIKWVESSKLNVTVLPPDELEARLEAGFRDVIASRPWMSRLPHKSLDILSK